MYVFVKAKVKDQEPLVGKPCTIVQDVGSHYLISCEGRSIFVEPDQISTRDEYLKAKNAPKVEPKPEVVEEKPTEEPKSKKK